MKDYYYILGLKQSATADEVKKAYRKLSLKFHPDKNGGDDFFTERFKEIQEAYETLGDNSKRKTYDSHKFDNSSPRQPKDEVNFDPYIEYFKSNKQAFDYDEEITLSWKIINADKVQLKPFGMVSPSGQISYKIKDFKNSHMIFEIIAENSNIGRKIKTSLTLSNNTYKDLYRHFGNKIRNEEKSNGALVKIILFIYSFIMNKKITKTTIDNEDKSFLVMILVLVLGIIGHIIFALTR